MEGILQSRFYQDKIEDIPFIVGSDCHVWSEYPAHHHGIKPAELYYMKSLPTFEGLVMAITDKSRILKHLPPKKDNILTTISLKVNGEKMEIPLSEYINVIIGDNSVGKSTLLKILSGIAQPDAIKYFATHNFTVETEVLDKSSHEFSSQGKIREMFERTEGKLAIKEKFKDYFIPIDKEKYKSLIKPIFSYYKRLWEKNDRINSMNIQLGKPLLIPNFIGNEKHYLVIDDDLKQDDKKFSELNKVFDELTAKFKDFNQYRFIIEKSDIEELVRIRDSLTRIKNRYKAQETSQMIANTIIHSYKFATTSYNEKINQQSNSDEQLYRIFKQNSKEAINNFLEKMDLEFSEEKSIWSDFREFAMQPTVKLAGKYSFIEKPINPTKIDQELMKSFISKMILIEKNLEDMSASEILTRLKGKRFSDKTAENINMFQSILISDFIDKYFKTTVEIKRGSDILEEGNSAGVNALNYIDIIANTFSKSIFIIDQPEDDVSQSRISSELIHSLKVLSKRAQVIFVTHNPQLVVNLDADNTIVIKKDAERLSIFHGPLEFKNSQWSMLEIIANTLDGGTDVIKKRWKRYEISN